jgi:hypothetical protein
MKGRARHVDGRVLMRHDVTEETDDPVMKT